MSSTVSAFLGCLFASLVVYLWSPKYSPANETDIARLVKQLVEQQMTLQATNQTFNSTTHAGGASRGHEDNYNSSLDYCNAQDEKLWKIEELESQDRFKLLLRTELKEKEGRLRQDFEAKLKMLALQSKEQMEPKVKELEEKSQRELETLKEEKEKLNEINKKLKEELTEEMKRKTTAIQQESKKELEFKVQNLTVELNNTLRILNEFWEAKLKTLQDTFLEKFENITNHLDLLHTDSEHTGFMKKETWGKLVLAVLPVVVFACCGFFCALRAKKDNGEIFNGRVVQGNNNKTRPLPIKIAIDANTISVVCFRNDEERRLVQLGEELIRDAQTKLPNLRVQSCVVNAKDDIRNIPSCKVALVFVYPDELEMILEDQSQHIGETLRKDVVEVLMDSTVKTILVIYNDPDSTHDKLLNNLFNPRLLQIKVHELLKKLNKNRLLLSIKDSFSDYQKKHLEQEIQKIL